MSRRCTTAPRRRIIAACAAAVAGLCALPGTALAAQVEAVFAPAFPAGTPEAPTAVAGSVEASPGDSRGFAGPLTVSVSGGVLFGRSATSPGCSPEQLRAGRRNCPAGSQIGFGSMVVTARDVVQDLSLTAFNAPGGAGMSILAEGDDEDPTPIRTVIPVTVGDGGTSLTFDWPADLVTPAAGVTSRLNYVDVIVTRASSWVHTVGCPGGDQRWSVVATFAGGGEDAVGRSTVDCSPAAARGVGSTPGFDTPVTARQSCAGASGAATCTSGGARRVAGLPVPVRGVRFLAGRRGGRIVGTVFADQLLGGHGSDRLDGRGGDDLIRGDRFRRAVRRQTDRLIGGSGSDYIYGGYGRNRISGGSDGDRIRTARRSRNAIWAGSGNDRIVARLGRGRIDCGRGRDRVTIRRGSRAFRLRRCETVRRR